MHHFDYFIFDVLSRNLFGMHSFHIVNVLNSHEKYETIEKKFTSIVLLNVIQDN